MKTSDDIAALSKALAAAQGEMRNATLNRVNPHFKNRYADLAAIRDAVVPTLAKHGIAVVQATATDEQGFRLVTRLTHESGQWLEGSYPLAIQQNAQAMGSQLTYARRYALSAITGISADEDDDAESAVNSNGKPITTAQREELQHGIMDADINLPAFLKYFSIQSLADLPANRFDDAKAAITAKAAKAKPKTKEAA